MPQRRFRSPKRASETFCIHSKKQVHIDHGLTINTLSRLHPDTPLSTFQWANGLLSKKGSRYPDLFTIRMTKQQGPWKWFLHILSSLDSAVMEI